MAAEVFIFARLHAASDQREAVRFLSEVEPLLDHPFRATLAEQIW